MTMISNFFFLTVLKTTPVKSRTFGGSWTSGDPQRCCTPPFTIVVATTGDNSGLAVRYGSGRLAGSFEPSAASQTPTASQEYPDTQEEPDSGGHSGGASGLKPCPHPPDHGDREDTAVQTPAAQDRVLAVLLALPSLLTHSPESPTSGSTS